MALASLIIAGILAIQTPQVQTYLTRKILDSVTLGPDAGISFGKIHFKPFNTLIIKDISVVDKAPCDTSARDTLFKAEYIIARFSLRGLRENEGIHIRNAYIRGAEMNMVIEEDRTNLERMFGISKDRVKKDSQGNVFDLRRAIINGMTFRLRNFRKDFSGQHDGGIDWSDLELYDINIEARHLKLADKAMSGTLDQLSFREKSGYVCNFISGSASVGHGISMIRDLAISDPWSDIFIPEFSMSYEDAHDFKDFVNRIVLDASVSGSRLDMKTLGFFVPGVKVTPFAMDIHDARVRGTVSDLEIASLGTSLDKEGVHLALGGRIKGLPEVEKMDSQIRIDSLSFTTASIEGILAALSNGKANGIDKYAPGNVFNFKGTVKGGLDSLHLGGVFRSRIGAIIPGLDITGLAGKGKDIEIKGSLGTWNLDIGRIVGSDLIHECTMNSSLRASIGKEGPKLEIDSLSVSRLNFKQYDYTGIAAAGTLAQEAFDGKIVCSDPNLSFLFQGMFSFSSKTQNALYRFYTNIGYADLYALNLDKRGMSRVSLQTSADFYRIKGTDMLGNINVSGITLENSHGRYDIGDLSISSHSSDTLYRVRLKSDFAEGSFKGSGSMSDFIRDVKGLTLHRQLPSMFRDSAFVWNNRSYDFTFRLFDTMDLLAFLAPGVYIAENTILNMHVAGSGRLDGDLTSQRIAYKEQFLKDVTLDFSNDENGFAGELRSETVSAASLLLKNNSLKIFAGKDHIGAGYTYDNQGKLDNRGEFFILGDLIRDSADSLRYKISLLPSSIYLNAREWNIMPSGLTVSGKDIDVENIEFKSGEQSLRIHGGISDSGKDTLFLDVERFDISIINPLLGKNSAFAGTASGNAALLSGNGDKSIMLDFLCDSTSISGAQMGTVRLGCDWNEDSKLLNASLRNSYNGKSNFDIGGTYSPGKKEMDMTARLDRLDISCISPYLSSIFSETSGSVSGLFAVRGKTSSLEIESTGARLDDATMRIAFTNVPYTLNGGFRIDSRGVYFDSISLTDRHGNPGEVTGEITYENFRDIRFNTRIDADRIECIDLNEKMSKSFYGHLFATAGISITGPMNAMRMSVEATTTGSGELHVPVSGSSSFKTSDLLTFKKIENEETVDPYEMMISRLQKREKSRGNFEINLMVAATPGVMAFVEIDKASGNVLSGYGSGTIDLDINPGKDIFNINGDYTLSGGNYRFVAIGLAKDFAINEGSSVKFNGDIMESTLNIDATYTTKTSLSALIADTSSVSSRRTVECGIHISDRISNPRLDFSINVPDIDPTVKARVESALSTEDKVQKQFLSLLVSNSFLPDEQSGIFNNTSFLASSVSEIMSNQLNTIFQKLDIPLDLGLNYQTNDRGNDIFDVAISTQLFNNRVVINGNIGNRQYTSGSTNDDVVGDLDIEIKIDRPGAFRLNLFSHSADQYTNYLDNSQRNGIGLTYQQEFNSFKEFFRKIFSRRKRKEAMQRMEEKALMNEEKVTIRIQDDNDRE